MFTGIIKGTARVVGILKKDGLVTFEIELPLELSKNIDIGASIALDGVCLTVTSLSANIVTFDVMLESLKLTTLGALNLNDQVNIERSASSGVEIGGHVVSGHVDGTAEVMKIDTPQNNYVITFKVPSHLVRYIFNKGFIAINGASLTVTAVSKESNTFQVWFIPETLRMTTFGSKQVGQYVNLEVDRNTQVIVDTVREFLAEHVGEIVGDRFIKDF